MKKTIVIIAGLLISPFTFAQVLETNDLYHLEPFLFNPAAAGSNDFINGFAVYKSQLSQVENAPEQIDFGIHSGLSDNMGLGAKFFNSTKGIFESSYIEASYSYRVNLNPDQQLTFGLSAGVVSRRLNLEGVSQQGLSDPLLQQGAYDNTNFTFGFGLKFKQKNFEFHAASPRLLEQDQAIKENFMLMLLYQYEVPGVQLFLTPSVFYQSFDYRENLTDFNLKATWKDLVWLQPSYRTNKSMLIAVGVNYEIFSLGYTYQMLNADMREMAGSGHEVGLVVRFAKRNKKKELLDWTQSQEAKLSALQQDVQENKTLLSENKELFNLSKQQIEDINSQLSDQQRKLSRLETTVNVDQNSLTNVADGTKSITPGYYIVVSTFESEERSKSAMNMLRQNNVYANIAHNEDNGLYYVYTFEGKTREETIFKMNELRKSGLKDTWVLVVK